PPRNGAGQCRLRLRPARRRPARPARRGGPGDVPGENRHRTATRTRPRPSRTAAGTLPRLAPPLTPPQTTAPHHIASPRCHTGRPGSAVPNPLLPIPEREDPCCPSTPPTPSPAASCTPKPTHTCTAGAHHRSCSCCTTSPTRP